MATIAEHIGKLSDEQHGEAVRALRARHSRLFPDYDVAFLSLPRNNPPLRREQLEQMISLLLKERL